MTTAIIVAFRTTPADLAACCRSLQRSGVRSIVVVDNSPDQAIAATAAAYQARYLPQPENIGFAAGANRGAARADAAYLLFLNPDAALAPGALEQARHYLESHPACGLAGLLLMSPAGRVERASFGAEVTPRSLVTRHWSKPTTPREPTAVGYVSGGALLIRRTLFQSLKGFDSRFFMYWEDVDLCRRARAAGYAVVLLPQATALHQRGASLSDPRRKTRLFDESADRYFAKYYPKSICLALRFLRSLYRLLSPQAW